MDAAPCCNIHVQEGPNSALGCWACFNCFLFKMFIKIACLCQGRSLRPHLIAQKGPNAPQPSNSQHLNLTTSSRGKGIETDEDFESAIEEEFSSLCYSSDDEDECPTCLEEYDSENPKITMGCSHQFHLGCIYEWRERSENCPICGRVMVYGEAA